MKNILLYIASLAIFLPLSTLARCITNTPNNNQVLLDVYDMDGNPLIASSRYYILPAYSTMEGGGLSLANIFDHECPTSVVQAEGVTDNGMAVYFMPENPEVQKIKEFSPLNIRFHYDYPNPNYQCNNQLVWKCDVDPSPVFWFISVGPQSGDKGWFQILPGGSKQHYKLAFCADICYYLGIVKQNGYLRLALMDEPMLFKFKLHPPIGKAEAY